MRYLLTILLAFGLASCGNDYDNWQTECTEKAALLAKSDDALKLLLTICSNKDVPKKCRDISEADSDRYDIQAAKAQAQLQREIDKENEKYLESGNGLGLRVDHGFFKPSHLDRCLTECESANFFSKRYGSCSKG